MEPIDCENAKVTLKVLQPPGGASSNIFGEDLAGKEQTRSRPVKDHLQSNVFGADLPASSSRTKKADESQQRLFGEPPEAVALQKQTTLNKATDNSCSDSHEKKKTTTARKGFNPITGQDYDDSESSSSLKQAGKEGSHRPQSDGTPHPSSSARTRQPPGGASSKLW